MDYQEFLERKKHTSIDYGITPTFLPDSLFDFQKHIAERTIKKGRYAGFIDTGLGKTLIELVTAINYVRNTNKPVLIITPLAVAFQFIKEAEKFGLDDISYSKDGKFTTKIVVCNYERLDKFTASDFDCVILDESSILKNFDGAIKSQVTTFLKKVKYRYLFTATPSPNDFIELGTSSEALGYLGYTDMLGKFFKNNGNSIDIRHAGCEWYLKAHAEKDFWRWVASWSISMRNPSDLGYSDEKHILPELIEKETVVNNKTPLAINGQHSMFNFPAQNFFEIKAEVRATIKERCEMAAQKCLNHSISFCWVNLNDEGNLLETLLPNSVQVSGDDDIEKKEEAIQWFVGDKCICDSKYFGLNWLNKQRQKCGNQNTQSEEEKNITMILQSEKDENINQELQKKIRSTWQSITKKIQKNLKLKTQKKETNYEESIINSILNIEKSVSEVQINTIKITHIKELNDLSVPMVLALKSITLYLDGSNPDAQFAKQNLTEVEKNLWLLTIAIKQIKSEVFCASTAISESDISKKILTHSKEQSCTCGHISGIRRMISKTKIFGFGLNLQHCNHTTYFPTYSYEQYYQAIRRFWRFGQKREVLVDLILSDGQTRIMESLMVKKDKAITMFENLTKQTNSDFKIINKEFNKPILLPNFLNA